MVQSQTVRDICFQNLYPHNKETFDLIFKALTHDNRTAVVQPTCTGKSYLIAAIVEHYLNANILIVSRSPNIHFIEIIKALASGGIDYRDYKNISFVSYATLHKRIKEEGTKYIESLNAGVILADEFHVCGSKEWGKSVQEVFDHYNTIPIIGFSATPIRWLDDQNDVAKTVFRGNVARWLTTADAYRKNILTPLIYVEVEYKLEEKSLRHLTMMGLMLNDDKYRDLRKDIFEYRTYLQDVSNMHEVLIKYLSGYENGRAVVHCRNYVHIEEMIPVVSGWFEKAFGKKPKTFSMCTRYSAKHNQVNLQDFLKEDVSENFALMFHVNMFNESLHPPDMRTSIHLRRTASPNLHDQQIGRIVSVHAGYRVVFDLVGNNKVVLKYLSRLKAGEPIIDEIWENEDRPHRTGKVHTSSPNAKDAYVGLFNSQVVKTYDMNMENNPSLLEVLWGRDDWYRVLDEVYDFVSNCGRYPQLSSPENEIIAFDIDTEQEKRLYSWLCEQLLDYRSGTMSPEHRLAMEQFRTLEEFNIQDWDVYYDIYSNEYMNYTGLQFGKDHESAMNWITRQQECVSSLNKTQKRLLNRAGLLSAKAMEDRREEILTLNGCIHPRLEKLQFFIKLDMNIIDLLEKFRKAGKKLPEYKRSWLDSIGYTWEKLDATDIEFCDAVRKWNDCIALPKPKTVKEMKEVHKKGMQWVAQYSSGKLKKYQEQIIEEIVLGKLFLWQQVDGTKTSANNNKEIISMKLEHLMRLAKQYGHKYDNCYKELTRTPEGKRIWSMIKDMAMLGMFNNLPEHIETQYKEIEFYPYDMYLHQPSNFETGREMINQLSPKPLGLSLSKTQQKWLDKMLKLQEVGRLGKYFEFELKRLEYL